MIYLNIASSSAHIDELKQLLSLLDHPFTVIGITETKIREGIDPITNVNIPGYEFKQTATKSCFWGACIYIKEGFDPVIRTVLSQSLENISECICVELKRESRTN